LGGLFFCGVFFVWGTVSAENERGGLTVSPAFQDIMLKQGDSLAHFSVVLTNETDIPMTLHLVVYDFGSLDESGGVAFLGATSDLAKKYALAAWMHPERDIIAIGAHETEKIPVTVENSDSLAPGGHYGALMFQVVDGSALGTDVTNDVSVKQMFSTLVFVKKIGGEIYALNLNRQEYVNHLFRFQDRMHLYYQNTGNVHVVPRGLVVVKDPLGRVVAKGIINQESTIILPETMRNYPVQLTDQAFRFVPGRYSLEMAYRYDGKDDFTVSTIRFDFIPLPATLGFLLLVATCGWYVARRRRKSGEKKSLFISNKAKNTNV
jgi:hypothetical protein